MTRSPTQGSVAAMLLVLGGCLFAGCLPELPPGANDETSETDDTDDELPCLPGYEGCPCSEEQCLGELACLSDLCVDQTGDDEETTSTETDTDTGDEDTTTSDSDGADPGTQPGNGEMYAACSSPDGCQAGLGLYCQPFSDNEGVFVSGFCTNDNCIGNGDNCDPSPGETSSPFCQHIVVPNYGEWDYCALECQSEVCPNGMECVSINGNGEYTCI